MLETTRLTLRHFKRSDLHDVHHYASQIGVFEACGWEHSCNIDESEEILDYFISDENRYAIVHKQDRKVIGHILLDPIADDIELAFALNLKYHRKGYMSEIIQAIIIHLRKQNHKYLHASTFVENTASSKLLEKNGFIYQNQEEYFCEGLNEHKQIKVYKYPL